MGGTMRYIGLRCWPDRFAYVVLEGDVRAPVVIASDTISIPADDDRPAFLNWISNEVRTILKRYPPSRCSYKAIEPTAFKNSDSLRRAQVEGVVQAVAHGSGCTQIASFTKQQIKARIGFDGAAKDVAQALKGGPLDELSGADFREAALAAWASLPD
jgi:Holliday junction resolvasome RuvABC endonuclease subunit